MALTLSTSLSAKLLASWEPSGSKLAHRMFCYSNRWSEDRSRLPGLLPRHAVRWLDEKETPDDTEDEISVDPFLDPSPRGRLDGLIETFVIGWPRARLVRPAGFGMDKPFQRMRPPRRAIVKMRTEATRTFGFFVRSGVFVAHRLDLANNTHANPELYENYGDDVLKLLKRFAPSDKDETSDVELLIGD